MKNCKKNRLIALQRFCSFTVFSCSKSSKKKGGVEKFKEVARALVFLFDPLCTPPPLAVLIERSLSFYREDAPPP